MNLVRSVCRVAAASLSALLAGCVPAAEEPEPRGAAGFHTEPSPAARGEPFVTSDGWTVHFERFAVSAYVFASGGNTLYYRWSGRDPVDIYSPGAPIAAAYLTINLSPTYLFEDTRFEIDIRELAITEDLERRFSEPADDIKAGYYSRPDKVGPSVIVTFVGEKDDRVVRVDLGLAGLGYAYADGSVDVRKDALSTTPLPLTPERFLSFQPISPEEARNGEAFFQPFADADRNGDDDGEATAAELNAYEVVISDSPLGLGRQTSSLLQAVSARYVLLFGSQSLLPPTQAPERGQAPISLLKVVPRRECGAGDASRFTKKEVLVNTTARFHDVPSAPGARTQNPAYQAYQLLHVAFIVAPIVAGIDKFFHVLTNWDAYLSPAYASLSPLSPHGTMLAVGLVEIVAGLVVALKPRIGGYVVAVWMGLIVLNLLLLGRAYDVALRDIGLCLSAIALGRLSTAYDRQARTA